MRRRIFGLAAAGSLLLAASVTLAADSSEAPIQLSNEHLELGREGLAEEGIVEAPPAPVIESKLSAIEDIPAPAEDATLDPEEPLVLVLESEPEPEAEPEPEPEPEPAVEIWRNVDETEPAARMTYPVCMERSIRGGNAFDESDRVCRVVTAPDEPATTAAEEGAEASS